MTTETTTTTDAGALDAGELDSVPAELAGIAALIGIDPEAIARAAARMSQAAADLALTLDTVSNIELQAVELGRTIRGIETVLRLLLAAAPMTAKMRRGLQAGLLEAGLEPSQWLTP